METTLTANTVTLHQKNTRKKQRRASKSDGDLSHPA